MIRMHDRARQTDTSKAVGGICIKSFFHQIRKKFHKGLALLENTVCGRLTIAWTIACVTARNSKIKCKLSIINFFF